MRRAWVCLLLLAAAACPAPTDFTPLIHVDPRAVQRANWFANRSKAPVEGEPKGARVSVMKEGQQLGGPNAIGRAGDLVLENGEVAFVIDQLGAGQGFAEGGGNLVDAADARARKDELGQMVTHFGVFPRQAVYDTLSGGSSDDGSAWVEAKGRELYESKIVVTTRYTLQAPDRALLIETTLENTGSAPLELISLGDAVQWGGAEKVAPGKARGFKGPSAGPYVGAIGRFTSYAITSTDGSIDSMSGGGWTDTTQSKNVKLAPQQKTSYTRLFVVGERPDSSSLVGELALAAGQPVGELQVQTVASRQAKLNVTPDGSSEALTLAWPFVAKLPAGRYSLATAGGSASQKAAGPVDVKANGKAAIALVTAPEASLEVRCVDASASPMPCKVTIEGSGGIANPDFGPGSTAGPARNQATASDGLVKVQLAVGRYRVTASSGPEYTLASVDVDLAPGGARSETLSPTRVVDTRGYLGCDFHQHTMLSADSGVSTRDRVIANVAEGVEVAVASEHNVVADLESVVKELHLEGSLVEIAGDELTSDASRHPWGHANVFPMPVDAASPRGGATPVRDRTAHDVFEGLRRDIPGDFLLQVNHPRSGASGYFDRLGFDRTRGVGTEPGYDAGFDALEVWNGRNADERDKVLEDWRAVLRTGHPVTATATTDTHGVVGQEAGYPRTYVRVADDGHLDAWDAARTGDLVRAVKSRRDVVLTNGPMLRATANGAPIGGVVKAPGGIVTLKVHVECAPWVDVDTVRVMRAGEGAREASKNVKLAPMQSGARAADVTFTVKVDSDDALFVVASGHKPLSPVLGGDEKEILPWAMTGALWIDADGDGRALGLAASR